MNIGNRFTFIDKQYQIYNSYYIIMYITILLLSIAYIRVTTSGFTSLYNHSIYYL